MLSDAEPSLTQGWAARMGEANEYNRYSEIARLEGSMRMDADHVLVPRRAISSPQSASARILP